MKWLQRLKGDAPAARPAAPGDRAAVAKLLLDANRRFGTVASEDQAGLLAGGASSIAFAGSQAIGFLGLHLRAPAGGQCWADISSVAIASGWGAARLVAEMLSGLAPALAESGATGLICLTESSWLMAGLAENGFAERDQVVSYARSNGRPLPGAEEVAAIRAAGTGDADAILEINSQAFVPVWQYDPATILGWLITADHAALAQVGGRPAGFALTSRATSNAYGQLVRIAIRPSLQGQGIGRQLVTDAIRYAHEAGLPGLALNTQTSNAASRHLYESLGFRLTGPGLTVMTRPVPGRESIAEWTQSRSEP